MPAWLYAWLQAADALVKALFLVLPCALLLRPWPPSRARMRLFPGGAAGHLSTRLSVCRLE